MSSKMSYIDYIALISRCKKDMLDLNEASDLSAYDLVQPKYDGWFTVVEICDKRATVITSGGEVRDSFGIDFPDTVFLCEWMYGTNWSQNPYLKGKFVVFDILSYDGLNFELDSYHNRLSNIMYLIADMKDSRFKQIESYPSDSWKDRWETWVEKRGWEGLVFKNSTNIFDRMEIGRMKKVFTMDYVCIGFKEGTKRLEGTLGALEGALYVNGVLTRICTVGGGFTDSFRDEIWSNQELYLGKVFEARGKAVFESGALRHPAFTRFRGDKEPERCVFNPRGIYATK